jgi:hypothetical protein
VGGCGCGGPSGIHLLPLHPHHHGGEAGGRALCSFVDALAPVEPARNFPPPPCCGCCSAAVWRQLCPASCLCKERAPPPPAILPQDARDFGSDGYSLRVQHKFSRHIKLLICVTLYNEDQDTLGKTLLGICEVRLRRGWPGTCTQQCLVNEPARLLLMPPAAGGLACSPPPSPLNRILAPHPPAPSLYRRTWRCCTASTAATATSTAWTGRRLGWPSSRTASHTAIPRCWPAPL